MALKYCIAFAGAPGSGKTSIAEYLSINLSLPIVSNDAVRREVIEDLGHLDFAEYEKRRDERLKVAIDAGEPFIYDASIDRSWKERENVLTAAGYKAFVISIELSRDRLYELYMQERYDQTQYIDGWLADHEEFIQKYSGVVNLDISGDNYKNRLELSLKAVQDWLKNA